MPAVHGETTRKLVWPQHRNEGKGGDGARGVGAAGSVRPYGPLPIRSWARVCIVKVRLARSADRAEREQNQKFRFGARRARKIELPVSGDGGGCGGSSWWQGEVGSEGEMESSRADHPVGHSSETESGALARR